MFSALYSDERIAKLRQSITESEQHLADCAARRITPYLQGLHDHWSGEPVVDFDYLSGIIRYEQEEDENNLWKAERYQRTGQPGLMCFVKS